MSIPKLKVYRLDEGYSESNDNDIQSQAGDELLPVVEKNLNLGDVEEMTGVVLRGDARLVIQDDDQSVAVLEIDPSDTNMRYTKMRPCDGWVLGKGNLHLMVKRKRNGDVETGISGYDADTLWFEVNSRMWDYEVKQVKMYRWTTTEDDIGAELSNVWINGRLMTTYEVNASGTLVEQETALNRCEEIVERDMIIFRLGDMLTKSNGFFEYGYSSYLPIFSNGGESVAHNQSWENDPMQFEDKVVVKYRKYKEYGADGNTIGDQFSTIPVNCRVPFGDIYNGNRNGRCIHYTPSINGVDFSTSVPANTAKSYGKMNYYEGNCNYRRRIFPLKYKVVHPEAGACNFTYEDSWYLDGMMKPVVMMRMWTGDRHVFKQLVEGEQVTKAGPASDGRTYLVSLIGDYYRLPNGEFAFPDKVYLFYNEVSDVFGDIFDFNYDYGNDEPNTGLLKFNTAKSRIYTVENGLNHYCVKRQRLAVRSEYGYDAGRGDILLNESNGDVSFTLDETGVEDAAFHTRIYAGTELIWESDNNELSGGNADFSVSRNGNEWTITPVGENEVPKDLLVVYHVKTPMEPVFSDEMESSSSSSSSEEQPTYYCGYRIPCYQKSKKSRLFVSSFPNWVKGHLNNDLDVFFGNRQYSGVEVKGTAVDTIMPSYLKEGWNAIYPEGAVMFNEEKEEFDWYDIFNYGASIANLDINANDYNVAAGTTMFPNYGSEYDKTGTYRIYYQKVKCNVAHYDGICTPVRALMSNFSVQNGYWYALLEDEDFDDAMGKRWVVREDGQIRRFFESGQRLLPEILSSGEHDNETASVMQTIYEDAEHDGVNLDGSALPIVRLKPDGNRVLAIRYASNGDPSHGATICLNPDVDRYGLLSSEADLLPGDIKFHIKISDGQEFCIKLDSDANWYNLPPVPAILPGIELSSVQDNWTTGPFESDPPEWNGLAMPRYRYVNENWYYDVYFEIFSYLYQKDNLGYDTNVVSSVEFVIYTVEKTK